MLSTVRRHSLRLQTELHRWSICDPGSHHLTDGFLTRVPACISRSKSCNSSSGESDGSRGSWSSSDSVISTDSSQTHDPGSPYRVVLLGASGVGKTAFASIFAGAADSMDSDDCELCAGEDVLVEGHPQNTITTVTSNLLLLVLCVYRDLLGLYPHSFHIF